MPKQDKELRKVSGKQLPIIWTKEKRCVGCLTVKPAGCFSRLTRSKDGLDGKCRDCNNKRNKVVYLKRRIDAREYGRKHYQKNKKHIYAKQKLNIEKNPERHRLIVKKSREKHRTKRLAYLKDYYIKNKVEISRKAVERYERLTRPRNIRDRIRQNKVRLDYHNRRKKIDPNYKLAATLRSRIHGALRRVDATKTCKSFELLGCTIPEYKKYLSFLFIDGMTWENHGEWHIDHIRPCASFDLTDPKQQMECFNYKNTQPLWATDNHKKGSKWSWPESRSV